MLRGVSQGRLSQVRLGQFRLGDMLRGVRLGYLRVGQVRLGQVICCVELGCQVRLGQVRLGQVICYVDLVRPVQSLLCGCRGTFLLVKRPEQRQVRLGQVGLSNMLRGVRPVQSLLCGCRDSFLFVKRPEQGIINQIVKEWCSTSIQPICFHGVKWDYTFTIGHKRPVALGGILIFT